MSWMIMNKLRVNLEVVYTSYRKHVEDCPPVVPDHYHYAVLWILPLKYEERWWCQCTTWTTWIALHCESGRQGYIRFQHKLYVPSVTILIPTADVSYTTKKLNRLFVFGRSIWGRPFNAMMPRWLFEVGEQGVLKETVWRVFLRQSAPDQGCQFYLPPNRAALHLACVFACHMLQNSLKELFALLNFTCLDIFVHYVDLDTLYTRMRRTEAEDKITKVVAKKPFSNR